MLSQLVTLIPGLSKEKYINANENLKVQNSKLLKKNKKNQLKLLDIDRDKNSSNYRK